MRIIFMIQEIARKLTKDNLTGYAAQSCFYIILSIFPCLLLLMSLFKFLPLTEDALLLMLKGVIPVQLEPFLVSIIEDMYDNSSVALTSITTIATIWAAGKGFLAIMQELNIIYDTRKKRNWLIQRLMSTVYTIALLVLIIATLLLLVFGNQLIRLIEMFIPRLAVILSAILNNRMILFPSFMILLFLLMYLFIPTRKVQHYKGISRSSFLSSRLVWIFLLLFALRCTLAEFFVYVRQSDNADFCTGVDLCVYADFVSGSGIKYIDCQSDTPPASAKIFTEKEKRSGKKIRLVKRITN